MASIGFSTSLWQFRLTESPFVTFPGLRYRPDARGRSSEFDIPATGRFIFGKMISPEFECFFAGISPVYSNLGTLTATFAELGRLSANLGIHSREIDSSRIDPFWQVVLSIVRFRTLPSQGPCFYGPVRGHHAMEGVVQTDLFYCFERPR